MNQFGYNAVDRGVRGQGNQEETCPNEPFVVSLGLNKSPIQERYLTSGLNRTNVREQSYQGFPTNFPLGSGHTSWGYIHPASLRLIPSNFHIISLLHLFSITLSRHLLQPPRLVPELSPAPQPSSSEPPLRKRSVKDALFGRRRLSSPYVTWYRGHCFRIGM